MLPQWNSKPSGILPDEFNKDPVINGNLGAEQKKITARVAAEHFKSGELTFSECT